MQDLPPEVVKAAPGVVGAAIAALFTKESPGRAFALWLAGCAMSYFVGGPLGIKLGIPESVAGLFVGVYGIAVVNKGFEALQSFPLGQLITDWAKSKLPSKD